MNLLCKLFAGSYDNIWKAIIRPNRDKYSSNDLGPYKFELNSKNYKRTDLIIPNKKLYKLKCSFWEPFDEEREYPQLPCVIYLHGNSSSRVEALGQLKHLLPLNITVFSFDFSGCGKSEGEYISLGINESDDVECVINYLKKTNKVSTIGLWGRSMGAVTCLLYASRKNNNLSAIFLDSPFYSLKLLIEELIEKNIKIPKFIETSMIDTLRNTILEKANFDIMDIEPYLFTKDCTVPAFFCHAKEDSLINVHHCNDLYNIYPGEKKISLVKGDHNTPRDKDLKNSGTLFFYHYLNLNDLKNNSIKIHLFNSNDINITDSSSTNMLSNIYKSFKFKSKIDLDNNKINNDDIFLRNNVNEKNDNENVAINYSYFQKCACNDLDKINDENKKMVLSSDIKEILTMSRISSEKNIKEANKNLLQPKNLDNIKKLKTASSTKNIYFKKNIYNPFTKSNTKIKPLVNNCHIFNDMHLINNNIKQNNKYNNNGKFFDNINMVKNKNFKIFQDDNRNNTINNSDNLYRKNLRHINILNNNKDCENINNVKNPFLFKFSNKNNIENEKQQKSFYRSKLSNTVKIRDNNKIYNNDKKWVIFEGINPYLKENKDYFKNKSLKKDNSLDDDKTIKNDETFSEINEGNYIKKTVKK